MYIQDGSPIDYRDDGAERKNIFAWGWLGDKEVSGNKLDTDVRQDIIDRLTCFLKEFTVDQCMGHHTCEICKGYNFNGSIKILYKNKLYICPSGVHHYIMAHNYNPTEEVVDAILNGQYLTQDEAMEYDKNDLHYQEIISKRNEEYLKKRKQEEEDEKLASKKAFIKVKEMSNEELMKRIKNLWG